MAELIIRERSDATALAHETNFILIHILSDALLWGLGFTQAIEARWPIESSKHIEGVRSTLRKPGLGEVAWGSLGREAWLASMIAESSRGRRGSELDFDALARCLAEVSRRARDTGAIVHTPVLGSGLSNASWDEIRPLIESELLVYNVPVVVHSLGSFGPRARSER
jgi:hypothetical protein